MNSLLVGRNAPGWVGASIELYCSNEFNIASRLLCTMLCAVLPYNRCFRCLLLLAIPHLFLSKALMSILLQTGTAKAGFGCSGLLYLDLGPSQQHSMIEAPFNKLKEEVAAISREHAIPVEIHSESGHQVKMILDYAKKVKCDLIILGHSGHSGLWGNLLG